MAKQFLFFIALAVVFTLSRSDPDQTPSDFPSEELIKYGFPIGLLPTNVKGYSLNQTTDSFVLFLDDKCRITLPPDNYLATYSKCRIKYGFPISVRAFFKWWGITRIRSSGDNLVFEVGMVTAKYLSKNFDESPEFCKYSIDSNLRHTGSEFESGSNENAIKHDDDVDYTEGSISLTGHNFDRVAHRYDPEMDGRILLRKVDCTEEVDLCRRVYWQSWRTNQDKIDAQNGAKAKENEEKDVLKQQNTYAQLLPLALPAPLK
nr:uncharacterized protein LOC109186882 [Ipomoea trifida]